MRECALTFVHREVKRRREQRKLRGSACAALPARAYLHPRLDYQPVHPSRGFRGWRQLVVVVFVR